MIFSLHSRIVAIACLLTCWNAWAGSPPGKPVNVQASDGVDFFYVSITCDEVAGADNYEWERAPSPDGPWTPILASPSSSPSITDSLYDFLEGYYYRVRAYSYDYGYSPYSDPDSGYGYTPPPDEFFASKGLFRGATVLTWEAEERASEYEVFRGDSESFEEAALIGTADEPLYVDVSGEPGLHYYYFVRSKNGIAVSYPAGAEVGYGTVGTPFRPDAQVGDRVRSLIGDNVYGRSRKQTFRYVFSGKRREVFALRFQNDGETSDVFRLWGKSRNRFFSVQYLELAYYTNLATRMATTGVDFPVRGKASGYLAMIVRTKPAARKRRARATFGIRMLSLSDSRLSDMVSVRVSTKRSPAPGPGGATVGGH